MYSFPPCMNLHNDFASCYQCFMLLLALCCLPAKLCISGATRQGGEVPTGSQLRSEGKIMRLIFISFVHVHFFSLDFIHPTIYLSIHMSIYPSIVLSYPSIYCSIHPFVHPFFFIHPFIILSYPPVHWSVLSVHPSIHPSIVLSCLSIHPSFHLVPPSIHPKNTNAKPHLCV